MNLASGAFAVVVAAQVSSVTATRAFWELRKRIVSVGTAIALSIRDLGRTARRDS